VTFHPVTSEQDTIGRQAADLFGALDASGRNFVVIAPNNDPGSTAIFSVLEKLPKDRFRLLPSMRFAHFSELMKNAACMVGNSSAGVREAPFLGLPSMLGWSLWKIGEKVCRRPAPGVDSEERPWTRREWLKSAVVALPVMTTFGAGGISLPLMTHFRIREMTLALDDLPAELDGLRIAHLTDTHVGKFTKGRVLDDLVAATNRLKADLVFFTGDLIDNTIRDLPAAVKMLQEIAQPLFVVEGNHDLFEDPAGFERGLRERLRQSRELATVLREPVGAPA
jgi:hypothetical protein